MTFDKTGTLTYGTPQVTAVQPAEGALSREGLYALAAGAEVRSEHPLGKAVVRCYRDETGGEPPAAEDFAMLPGRGVRALVNGCRVEAGNPALIREEGAAPTEDLLQAAEDFAKTGCTLIYLAVDGQCAGFLALADTLRPHGAKIIRQLQSAGVTPVLLTGDHENAAGHIARQLGISVFQAGCLPEDKLQWIDRSQSAGEPVCMIGDGINDAPALKKALVGIAMGGIGSDIAVDAADIVLVNDDIRELPHLFLLARRMMRTIRLNLTFSMALNFLAIFLAIIGTLEPVVGALVHNAGSVAVILHSALLLSWHRR